MWKWKLRGYSGPRELENCMLTVRLSSWLRGWTPPGPTKNAVYAQELTPPLITPPFPAESRMATPYYIVSAK